MAFMVVGNPALEIAVLTHPSMSNEDTRQPRDIKGRINNALLLAGLPMSPTI